jgi:RNase P protein component
LSGARLSVIVPIKVNKRAVIRNHFRRLAYDKAWQFISNKKIDCIIMFKPLALLKGKESDSLITTEIQSIFTKF